MFFGVLCNVLGPAFADLPNKANTGMSNHNKWIS